MEYVNMSVYASKDANQGVRPDGVHLPIDYAITTASDGSTSRRQVAIHETAREDRFAVHGPGLFTLAVWTVDEHVDVGKSWLRCTFRPAHDVGVSNVTSPMNPADTAAALKGLHLSETADNTAVDWEVYGMLERRYTGIWWTEELWRLQNYGQFEIAVQVGLHYTDGSDPVYCIVDPEMDLDPGNR